MIKDMNLNESTILEFEISITGTTEKPKARFIIETTDFGIMCRCENTEKGIKIWIPKLQNIIESGTYNTRLEVLIDNKIFVPLQEQMDFLPVVDIQTRPLQESPKAASVVVTTGKILSDNAPARTIPLPEIDMSWKEKGFDSLKNPFG